MRGFIQAERFGALSADGLSARLHMDSWLLASGKVGCGRDYKDLRVKVNVGELLPACHVNSDNPYVIYMSS